MKKLRVLEQPCCAPGSPPLPKRSAEALAERFKALSDPARVAIVNRIAGAPDGELCTCHLTGPLGLSQPMTFYRLVPDAMEQLAFAIGGGPSPEGVLVTQERAVAW